MELAIIAGRLSHPRPAGFQLHRDSLPALAPRTLRRSPGLGAGGARSCREDGRCGRASCLSVLRPIVPRSTSTISGASGRVQKSTGEDQRSREAGAIRALRPLHDFSPSRMVSTHRAEGPERHVPCGLPASVLSSSTPTISERRKVFSGAPRRHDARASSVRGDLQRRPPWYPGAHQILEHDLLVRHLTTWALLTSARLAEFDRATPLHSPFDLLAATAASGPPFAGPRTCAGGLGHAWHNLSR